MFKSRFSFPFRLFTAFVALAFVHEIILQDLLQLHLSKAEALGATDQKLVLPSQNFTPAGLRAIRVNPKRPYEIDFIVNAAEQGKTNQQDLKKLIKYFLTVLTTPERDLWVNLSPYEANRIIPEKLGETAAGREMLSQDHLLKQLASSLTYPESKLGREFWDRVYKKAMDLYGTTEVPIDTFQKVWIIPDKAVVYEYGDTAFISESHLKVLLDEDYVALQNTQKKEGKDQLSLNEAKKVNQISSSITREIILPAIEKEVNEGKNFAPLRQIFHSLILATWFKVRLREHLLSRAYVDQRKIKGLEDNDSANTTDKIYEQYLQTFKDGVYNYIREDYDADSESIITRQYFSGGVVYGVDWKKWLDIRKISRMAIPTQEFLNRMGTGLELARIQFLPLGGGPSQQALRDPVAQESSRGLGRLDAGNTFCYGKYSLTISPYDQSGRDRTEFAGFGL